MIKTNIKFSSSRIFTAGVFVKLFK